MPCDGTLLFYDLETSGLHHAFDQVVQYAGVRTDHALNTLDETVTWVQLTPGVVPDPMAVWTHRITPEVLTAKGVSEWDMIRQVHQDLNTEGTWSGGYNTLGFDDTFLRFSFDRHLLDPYTHQYRGGCGRFDLYPIVALYAVFAPDALAWPRRDDGQLSLKLEALVEANGWSVSGRAHDALVDVQACLALCRALRARRDVWEYAWGYFDKRTDQGRTEALVEQAGSQPCLALLVEGAIGAGRRFMAPACRLGTHRVYGNQTLWLRLDMFPFEEVPREDWALRGAVVRKKWAEPPLVLPPKPRYLDALTPSSQSMMERNLAWLGQLPGWWSTWLEERLTSTYPQVEGLDVDAALYQRGFRSTEEQMACRRFHQATSWEERLAMVAPWRGQTLGLQAQRLINRYHAGAWTWDEGVGVDERGVRRLERTDALQRWDALCERHGVPPGLEGMRAWYVGEGESN